MTTIDPVATAVTDSGLLAPRANDDVRSELPAAEGQGWARVEAWLDRLGDRLNPILVKEARQSMKSRQFVITFSLLLIFGWMWTLLFIAFSVPAVYYAPYGSAMLVGYYIVLTVPLLIVVPYSSFRSLAAEREDGTYELLSITSLSARQIVTGKLGSSLLQMLVYYSALAPCIAFTYLLRGIDVVTIGLYLVYTFLASLMLCILGLTLATVTRSRHWQVLLSVVFVMALLVFGFIWDIMMLSIMGNTSGTLPYDNADFWIVNSTMLSFYAAFAVLFLLIAAGQITFASENRSTKLRVVLVAIQLLLSGWITYGWLREMGDDEWFFVEFAFSGALWMIAGAFLTGETAQLSPRAKRELPQSLLGRMAFTWFNPGSGSGYTFAVLNLTVAALLIIGKVTYLHVTGSPHVPTDERWLHWTLCIWGYVAGYLGLGRLAAAVLMRRIAPVGMMVTFLFHLILLLAGLLVPILIQGFISWGDFSRFQYSELHLSNWILTLIEIGRGTFIGSSGIALLIAGIGLVIFVINLLQTAHEVEQVRLAVPTRVLEDDMQLHPQPAVAVAKSPWDK